MNPSTATTAYTSRKILNHKLAAPAPAMDAIRTIAPRRDMNDAVHLIHHEDAKKHVLLSDSGNEAEIPTAKKTIRKSIPSVLAIVIFYWFKGVRLWQGCACRQVKSTF